METPEEQIATVEEFTHAIIGIVRTITIRNGEEWTPYDQISQMLTARDTATRTKCAERAIAWCNSWNGFIIQQPESGKILRAAIMAEQEEAQG